MSILSKPIVIIALLIAILGLWGNKAHAALDPKLRVMMVTAGYGTVGGALLGTATLAFGGSSRAIFQGASLGLYAGLIFGGYILYSHHNKVRSGDTRGQYPDNLDSPYKTDSEADESSHYTYRWSPQNELDDFTYERELRNTQWDTPKSKLPIYINLVNWSF